MNRKNRGSVGVTIEGDADRARARDLQGAGRRPERAARPASGTGAVRHHHGVGRLAEILGQNDSGLGQGGLPPYSGRQGFPSFPGVRSRLLVAVALGALLYIVGCSAPADLPPEVDGSQAGSGGAGPKPVPQITPTYCVTELAPETTECDANHLLVVHCTTAVQVPNYRYCYDATPGSYGRVFCCTPSYASACGEQCP